MPLPTINLATYFGIQRHMPKPGYRLAFLVIEVEPGQALSARKLLLESAKHNVLTAHSGREGVDMLKRFPNVDVVAVDSQLSDMDCSKLADLLKEQRRDIRIVALSPRIGDKCDWASKTIDSHDPAALLKLLEEMGGRADI